MLIRNNKFAVLVSHGYGAGWSSWNKNESNTLEMCTNERLVLSVLGESDEKPIEVANELFPEEYDGGVEALKVEWIDTDMKFRINEYHGKECVEQGYSTWFN